MKKIIINFLLSTIFLYAHPHTFINIYPTLIQKDGYVKYLNIKWILDEMTSSMLIMEFDQNGNGKIDKNENDYIRDNYFMSLQDYSFYTYIKGRYKIDNFQANIKDNKIEYNFRFIPLKKTKVKGFKIEFYDEDFFVSMQLKEEFVTQKIPHIVKDLDGDWFFGYILIYK